MPDGQIPRAAYFTKQPLARAIALLALNAGRRLLEPSCGDGSIIREVARVAAERGDHASLRVTGVEIDPAFAKRAGQCVDESAVVVHAADFFSLSRRELGQFDACMGNPPFVRHHELTQNGADFSLMSRSGFGAQLSRSSNLFCYFISHASSFLRPGGRIVFALPAFSENSVYFERLTTALCSQFRRVTVIRWSGEAFIGTRERSLILLADGYTDGPCAPSFARLSESSVAGVASLADPSLTEAPGSAIATFSHARTEADGSIGEFTATQIGIVTGASRFFVRSQSDDALPRALRSRTVPVIADAKSLRGAAWSASDARRLISAGRRSHLIQIDTLDLRSSAVRGMLSSAAAVEIQARQKCSARRPWYRVPAGPVPDFFIKGVATRGPAVIANEARWRATNVLVCGWLSDPGVTVAQLVVSSWTSPYRLLAEISGHRLGGGALRADLDAIRRLPVWLRGGAEPLMREVDIALRAGFVERATSIADGWASQRAGADVKAVFGDAARALKLALADRLNPRSVRQEHRPA